MTEIFTPPASAVAGQTLEVAPAVKVTTVDGRPVPNVAVTFAVKAGGGSVAGAVQMTNTEGTAEVRGWTLGVVAGTNVLTAQVPELGSVTFTVNSNAGPAAKLSVASAPSESAENRVPFPVQPVVQLRDAYDNAVAQSAVVTTVALTDGGGVLGGTTTAVTGSDGSAAFTDLSISGLVGLRTLTFSSPELSSVTAVITTAPGAAKVVALNGGDGQSGTAGSQLTAVPSVRVNDVDGNGVGGVAVTFEVASGGGSITGGSQRTNESGVATVGSWTLGPSAGPNTLTAFAPSVGNPPVSFSAVGLPGVATRLVLSTPPSSTAQNRAAFATQPVLQLSDRHDNPVPRGGVTVSAAITDGGGTLGGTTTLLTASNGAAALTDLSIRGAVGTRTLTFSAVDLTSATSTVTTSAGASSVIALNGGDNQSAVVGMAVAIAPSVKVTDSDGNPVGGVTVTFAVASGGGNIGATSPKTDVAGVASVGRWTLGTTAGPNSLAATASGVSSPVSVAATATEPELELLPVVSGLASPVFLGALPGDSRLFIVEQGGRIRVVKDGQLLPTPYLDVSAKITSGGESGLLGLAFHPRFVTNGYFYVNYTDLDGNTVIERYRSSPASDVADAGSGTPILQMVQPFSNHNGGMLLFGTDDMLWIGTGDGGSGGDPFNHGQRLNSLLGKMLRIDVDHGAPYAVPPDNPFVSTPDARGEIWGTGLRNPWRYAFDRDAQLLYVADVGQSRFEEVHVVSVNHAGVNFGWKIMEGTHCFEPSNCDSTGLDIPVLAYGHDEGCSITGGFVYRGDSIPGKRGHYFYSDYCTGFLRSFKYVNGAATERRSWNVGTVGNVLSFGEDGRRELYVLSANGTAYKLRQK